MKRYITLFFHFLRLSWIMAMQYRANFLIDMSVDVAWSLLDLLFMNILIANTRSIGHWNAGQMMVVIGVFRIFYVPIKAWLEPSFAQLAHILKNGNLDMLLTKPISTQFLASVQKFSLANTSSLITGSVFMALGFITLHQIPTVLSITIFLWLCLILFILIYSMYFFTMSFALFFDRIQNIHSIFPGLYDVSRFPREIYGFALQRVFTLIIPIAIMIAVPVDALLGIYSIQWTVVLHVLTLAFFFAGTFVWKRGLLKYQSASS